MSLPHLPPSLESERQRLADMEVDIAKRKAALQDRRNRLKDEAATVLQLEASLIELAQENEASLRLLNIREVQLEERMLALDRQEEDVLAAEHRAEDEYREAIISHNILTLSIEDRWRGMEESAHMAEEQHQHEMSRLRKLQSELDEREAMLRDRQREYTHREQAVAAWQRRLQTKKSLLNNLSRNAIEKLLNELQEREAILQMD